MKEKHPDKRSHLILSETSQPINFKAHSAGGRSSPPIPAQQRQRHAQHLLQQITDLKPLSADIAQRHQELELESSVGMQVHFRSQPNVALAFESLGNETKHIELLSVKEDGDETIANVFVPLGKLEHFERYIRDYLAEKKNRKNESIDHQKLIDAIADIRAAEIRALWTDDLDLLPENKDFSFWWEVWLPVRSDDQRVDLVNDFKKLARLSNCTVLDQEFHFPERTVLLMQGSQNQLSSSVLTLNCIAELRYAKDTADFFDGMDVNEQRDWSSDLLQRTQALTPSAATPYVCLLDSGVTRGNPLLASLLDSSDMHSVNPAWGTHDEADHGTGLAGLAAYGDLTEALASGDHITIDYRLESVKLLTNQGGNTGGAKHHANLFTEGVSRPEIFAPNRLRVFASAVTATDYRDYGRPSSWSAAVDSLASDASYEGANPRLFVLAAGNIKDSVGWSHYPHSLSTNLIHDPGQSWNALTIGAYTKKVDTENHPSLKPVAPDGGMSPFSTTSCAWDKAWPLKPDVVLEGGNLASDVYGTVGMASLNLLTVSGDPSNRLFTTSNATSAASALGAGFAAKILAAYPHLRPETVRALIVHSAEWTEEMLQSYLPASPTKDDYANLIRHCGWGVPSLEKALWSASDSLTLVIQDQLQPYQKPRGKPIATKDMSLHSLPWPVDELEALQDVPVEMKVTLSYFIEPNPSTRGISSKYYYPSHRLRFDVKRSLEASNAQFIARLNAAAEIDDNNLTTSPESANWLLGERQRHKGSLHQDIWKGTAADLASKGVIGIYPSSGWWRSRPGLAAFNRSAPYSLIVSIKTPENSIDLYSAIQQKIQLKNAVII